MTEILKTKGLLNLEAHEAKLRFENSKELFERAQRIYDRDLNSYVAAMGKVKNASDGEVNAR